MIQLSGILPVLFMHVGDPYIPPFFMNLDKGGVKSAALFVELLIKAMTRHHEIYSEMMLKQ